MNIKTLGFLLALVVPSASGASAGAPHDLTFEERVRAQEALERAYYSHQLGTTRSFEEAVPRELLERKVHTYLKQSAALDRVWGRPVTAAALHHELQRMARGTQMPERLRELYAALGDDPVLIEECLARPALVQRWVQQLVAHAPGLQELQLGTGENRAVGQPTYEDWWNTVASGLDESTVTAVADPTLVFPRPADGAARTEFSPGDHWDNGLLVSLEARGGHTLVWTGSEMIVWGGELWNVPIGTGRRYDPLTDSWSLLSAIGAPAARWAHTAVWTGNEMIVWGGFDGATGFDSGGRYDPATDTWVATSAFGAPERRWGHTAIWTGSQMIIWGGIGDSGDLASGARYDPVSDSWTPTTATNAPTARSAHTAVWTGSKMIVWGGTSPAGTLKTGARYDPAANAWTPTEPTHAPAARKKHTAVWTGSEMIVWGGVGSSDQNLNSGGHYNPGTNLWTATGATGAPSPRTNHTAVWTGARMVVWGGSSDYPPTGGRYDPSDHTWTATTLYPVPGSVRHAAIWTGTEMIVWGGQLVANVYVKSGARYDPVTNNWIPCAKTVNGAPDATQGHSVIWTGSHMIVWGGIIGTTQSAAGGRYDPATDTWTPTTAAGAPQARSDHSAIWTGNEMIVWGGVVYVCNPPLFCGQLFYGNGGRYDPIADTWTPTSGSAPHYRSQHSVVWTGEEMIVWGGQYYSYTEPISQQVMLNSGGRYSPVNDSWTPTSLLNAPTARMEHTAVWTGNEMIVWGGGGVNTGARYRPSTDSWTPTATSGAPQARSSHTAVWTGDRMIVWGGNGVAFFNNGGLYDPAADAWSPMSTAGAPAGRTKHTAIWTGGLMIVWGGTTSWEADAATNGGGLYSPSADLWTPTGLTSAPDNRYLHKAIWTGNEMIAWGGHPNFLDDGGRYVLSDADGDGTANATDCAPSDPGAFVVPGEVVDLEIAADKTTLSWDSAAPGAGSATRHDVLRGVTEDLPVGGGVSESCLASDVPGPTAADPDPPAAGQAFYYLVRGTNLCGVGTYGSQSDGVERNSVACP